MNIVHTEYEKFFWEVLSLLEKSKKRAVQTINTQITQTYWSIGKYIVEFEQKWEKRAGYGDALLKKLSEDLTKSFWKGFSYTNLKQIRQFYTTFQKGQTLSDDFKKRWLKDPFESLSWSHFVRLVSVREENERNFYLIESLENNWSVRELDRQINSCIYERLILSTDKQKVKELWTKWQIIEKTEDILKDPYILEFLWLEEKASYSESELESAIINNLERFLLEFGKWFAFVSRQQRFTAWTDHFYIDLVFYNRLLRCFVLVDLKIWKITHGDIGQMQMYVNYYDREIKKDFENKTIWILLCKEKHDLVVEYTLPEDNNQIFAKEYKLYLPKKEELQKLLESYL